MCVATLFNVRGKSAEDQLCNGIMNLKNIRFFRCDVIVKRKRMDKIRKKSLFFVCHLNITSNKAL